MPDDFETMVERGAKAPVGRHCTTCGSSVNNSGRCLLCGGIACRADKRDPVAPDPPCWGCKVRAERVLTAAGVPELLAERDRLREALRTLYSATRDYELTWCNPEATQESALIEERLLAAKLGAIYAANAKAGAVLEATP